MQRVDHAATVAYRKIGSPAGFSMCGWQTLDDGSVLYRMKKELPHKEGERVRWTGEDKTACITLSEIAAEVERYESEEGRCHKCFGTKEQWAGWNHVTGNRYVPCTRCGATGIPPQKAKTP